jgi:voltage-gated sodium channel
MVSLLVKVRDARWFQNTITLVILAAGVLVGIETYEELAARHAGLLHALDQIVIWVFVAEALLKIGAEGRRPWRYFLDPWNVFDFLIVAVVFLPIHVQYVLVLRLARLLRVLKLVRAVPRLQILVSALLKSMPSMAYVGLLLGLLFYVYGVAATFLFAKNDPIHFGSLPLSIQTLFGVVTLEGWVDLMYLNQYGCDAWEYPAGACLHPDPSPIGAPALFISLVFLGTMIVLNLFIGVIMNGMQAAQEENLKLDRVRREERSGEAPPGPADELAEVGREIASLQARLKALEARLREPAQGASPSAHTRGA